LNDLAKNIILWVVIVLVLLAVFSRYMPTVNQAEDVSYSAFLKDVKAGRVDSVVLQGVARMRLLEPLDVRPTLRARVERISEKPGRDVEIDSVVSIPGAWLLSNRTLTPNGKVFTGPADTTACTRDTGPETCIDWLASLHLTQEVTYQPLSRFWRFQWLETGLYTLVALLLCGFSFWWARRRVT